MKIVFLDIDGVLNSPKNYAEYVKAAGRQDRPDTNNDLVKLLFDKDNIAALNRITTESGAKIVISSSWKLWFSGGEKYPPFQDLVSLLKEVGVEAEVIGKTPDVMPTKMSQSVPRGREIQAWLDENRSMVDGFVILDDCSDMIHLKPRLVRTQGHRGLSYNDADLALIVLDRVYV